MARGAQHLIESAWWRLISGVTERARPRRRVPLPPSSLLATALLGLVDECIQAFIPRRVFDAGILQPLAAVMAVATSLMLGWRGGGGGAWALASDGSFDPLGRPDKG